jgi:uncharacterized membrane protein YagU involved in acid resistance
MWRNFLLALAKESVRSGAIASLVMMPPGFLFKAMGLRVGHYGPKLGEVLFGNPSPAVLFAQHIVIGWLSAIPLLLLFGITRRMSPVLAGTLYGGAYYVTINALALPMIFGDPMPWQLGLEFVYPSLVVHLVYGASIGFTARGYAGKLSALKQPLQNR